MKSVKTWPVLMEEKASEIDRLKEDEERSHNWKRWGPYLSERQWGTVREDYSADGDCWNYFTHDQSRSRAYRWGEDGLLGFCDRQCRLCFGLSLWNGKDTILKERMFGLINSEGNHGEDVKELYYYQDSTPTHSYMKSLYKYPQSEFPYTSLVEENQRRGVEHPEYELLDTGAFADNKYYDVTAEYAKRSAEEVLGVITVTNRSDEHSQITVLPTLWYRNTWIWGCKHEGCTMKPSIKQLGEGVVHCKHETLPKSRFYWGPDQNGKQPKLLFTENETNSQKLFGVDNYTPYVKDAFHRYVINHENDAVQPDGRGTKVAGLYVLNLGPGESFKIKIKLDNRSNCDEFEGEDVFSEKIFDQVVKERICDADEFYSKVLSEYLTEEEKHVSRQAFASLLFTKQFYHYVVKDWLAGDPDMPAPPQSRLDGRNTDWKHLFNRDVISMPDKWEYPWYATWDLAFHMLPMGRIDPKFAKDQLMLFLREWFMSPNGQIPAYEFNFSDVNPPVHALAVFSVFKMTGHKGNRDNMFLARCFQKLILNFTWWVNRKDPNGHNIFSGGFLGLDNIGVFDRSQPLPKNGQLEQADGTAWMGFFSLAMLGIALDLALEDPSYEDMASKFFEHFVAIVDAMNALGGHGLWHEEDGFYYDKIRFDDQEDVTCRIRSMVGLIPLFSVLVLEEEVVNKLPGFKKRLDWFLKNRKDISENMVKKPGSEYNYLLSIAGPKHFERISKYMFDEEEFLSEYGIRSLSRYHKDHPFEMCLDGQTYRVPYTSGESKSNLFGGNSNWRGPIWFPVNYVIMKALERYDFFYGDSLKVEFPTGSGNYMRLKDTSVEIASRLSKLFLPDGEGKRPCHGNDEIYWKNEHWKDEILFYEFFDGCTGRGCGASHQTGWTALVTDCLQQVARARASKDAETS
eukprot:TCONS_00058263-protein